MALSFRRFTLPLALPLALAVACVPTEEGEITPDPDPIDEQDRPGTIVEVAAEAGTFTTLLAAAEAAGLVDALSGDGPLTVFAPTDAAFAALPDGTVDALLNDIPALTEILLYHVVAGELTSDVVVGSSLVTTLQGSDIKVAVDGSTVSVGGAAVTAVDIEASNGVIHVIDTVITPPGTIAEIAVATPELSTLVAALQAADLVDAMNGEGPYTVFAPLDSAFEALPAGTLDALLADTDALTSVLLYHVVGDKLPASEVVGKDSIPTLHGAEAAITVEGGAAFIDGAAIVVTDIPAANGVIHLIDAVIVPE